MAKYNLDKEIDRQRCKVYFTALWEQRAIIELKKPQRKRTIKQNAYLHVVIDLWGIHFGYDRMESKAKLKRMCGFMAYEKKEETFYRSTSDLDVVEAGRFVDWIRNWAGQHECYIPDADEYLKEQEYIDQEIYRNAEFL